jgi:hypothetical protein
MSNLDKHGEVFSTEVLILGGGLAIHNVLEFSNLRSFLPQIYQEEHDKAA